jgi:Na+/pantothenate symporter
MTWFLDHAIVVVFLGGYLVLLVRHALHGRRRTEGMADYYVGGRKLGGIALGLSFFATYSSTNSFIGFSGQSYTYGAPWLLIAPFVVGFSLLAWVLVAPRLRRFTAALGSLTIPDFIGFRFGSTPARVVASALVLFASFFYLTAVFKGIGTLLEAFLSIPYAAAVWITFLIVMTYTAVGGFISVVKTDAVQGVMLIIAALILFQGTVSGRGRDRAPSPRSREFPRRRISSPGTPRCPSRCSWACSSPRRSSSSSSLASSRDSTRSATTSR